MTPHKRVTDEPSVDTADRYVHSRKTDHDFFARASEFTDRYKLLVWLVFIGLLAIGFDFKTPAQTTRALQVQIDTVKDQVKSGAEDREAMNRKLDILVRLECNSKQISDEAKLIFCPKP